MNIFFSKPETRLNLWMQHRETMSDKSLMEKLDHVAWFWSEFPLVNYSLDPYNPSAWPTPWEMLYDGNICQNGIAYMMAATLALMDVENVCLKVIRTSEREMLITQVDDIVLGYIHGRPCMTDLLPQHTVQTMYAIDDNGRVSEVAFLREAS